MPESTRCACPRHPGPTRPTGAPYVLHTESSPPQVHCHRRRVALLLGAVERPSGSRTSTPKRRSRLSQARWGSAPSRRAGRVFSQPRTRHPSGLGRHPPSGGPITPTMFPRSFCWLCKRPAISVTRSAGSPRASRACGRASAACGAGRRSRARRSWACRRRCLALARGWACGCVRDTVRSVVSGGSCAGDVSPGARDPCPLASGSVEGSLWHAPPVLPAFFCELWAGYTRPYGLAPAHPVFCTPHRPREGGRCPVRSFSTRRFPCSSGVAA